MPDLTIEIRYMCECLNEFRMEPQMYIQPGDEPACDWDSDYDEEPVFVDGKAYCPKCGAEAVSYQVGV